MAQNLEKCQQSYSDVVITATKENSANASLKVW